MQFRISYQEIQNIMAQKSGRSVPFVYDSPHSVRITASETFASMGITFTIRHVSDSNVDLEYSGGIATNFLMKQAMKQAVNQPGADIIEMLDGNNIRLHLDRSAQFSQLLERITLQDICFDEQFVIIQFASKGIF